MRGQSPRQRYGIDRAFCLAIANFKGGVAKTFTASTFAQYLALRGWRVLLVDLDPQASLSTTFGLNSTNTSDWNTMLPYLYGREFIEADKQEFPKSFREVVLKTYWDNIDLVAATLNLYSGDFYLALRRQQSENEFPFHRPIAEALEDVRGDYDVIILDTPPSLSLTTTGALFAADGVLVPTQAELIDYESARAFIRLATEMLEGIGKGFNDWKTFDLFRVLITRYKTSQINTAQDILAVFGERCLPEPMVDSAAVCRQLGRPDHHLRGGSAQARPRRAEARPLGGQRRVWPAGTRHRACLHRGRAAAQAAGQGLRHVSEENVKKSRFGTAAGHQARRPGHPAARLGTGQGPQTVPGRMLASSIEAVSAKYDALKAEVQKAKDSGLWVTDAGPEAGPCRRSRRSTATSVSMRTIRSCWN